MRRWLLAAWLALHAAPAPAWAADDCCKPTAAPAPAAGPVETLAPVALTDQRGATVRLPDGRPWVVTFFFGNCKNVCPTLLYNLGAVAEVMPEATRRKVGFAAISFDPARDTVPQLAQYQINFELTGEHFHLMTGAPADLARIFKTFAFDYKPDRDGGFQHTTLMAVMDGQGRVVQHFYGLTPDIERIAAAAGKLATP